MKASDLFVRCLEEEGVEYIFAVPGEENLDVVESLRTSSIQLVVTRHEQHAAFMAATYGRLTGKAGVCMSTLGPGATNLLTGLAYAQLCGVPLVAITGQKGIKNNWQGNFQIVDVVGTFKPVTKWNHQITSSSTIPRFVRHAFKVAEDERPGATHLELPEDIADEQTKDLAPFPRVRVRRPIPDEKAIEGAIQLIRSAKTPLVLLSAGANRKRVGKQLVTFMEKLGIFAVSTQMGKGVVSDAHPQSLFCLGIHKKDYVHAAIEAADLIITIGYSIVEYPPFVWNSRKDKRILHLDYRIAEPDEFYSPDVELIGDVSAALWAIHSRMAVDDRFDTTRMANIRSALDERLHCVPPNKSFPPGPRQIVHAVREALDDEDIICLDNGIYKLWFARMYQSYSDNTVLLDNALATMGAGLASAMAAKLVVPEQKVVAICGDGGFMMNSQDLETAVRLRQDLVILLLRDEGYGFIRWKQQGMGFEEFGMSFGNPDFVKYAEAYGATGIRVTESLGLSEALRRAFEVKGPVLIDCPIDYSDNALLSQDVSQELQDLMK
ncbi:MAG: acetolactate synthase large subunit [Myxococcota bacterium]